MIICRLDWEWNSPGISWKLFTRAKNANAHPGLVDISEDSDPERANHNSKRKAARSKAKEVKASKETKVVELEQLIAKLQGEIAKRDAQEVVSTRSISEMQLTARASPIEEIEEPPVPPSSPIEEIFEDVDVEMSDHDGGADDEKAGSEGPQSSSEMVVADFEMEAEKTLENVEVPAAAMVPGGPLRRSNAVFFGRNSQGDVVVLDRSPIESRVALNLLAMNPDQSRKRKAVVHEEDPPAEPPSSGKALHKLEQAAKPAVKKAKTNMAKGLVMNWRDKVAVTGDVPLPNISNTTLHNPWDGDSTGEEIDALQQSWSTWFPKHKELVTPSMAIYKVAAQRLYEWRSNVGKRGIAAVQWLWKDRKLDTEEERSDYVSTHLKPRYYCMYWDNTNGKGAFQAEVLMRTFAVYLGKCDHTTGSLINFGLPVGGLAMCAAAVERGLLLYQTGRLMTEQEQDADVQSALDEGEGDLAESLRDFYSRLRTFSEGGWSTATHNYVKVILKLDEKQWGRIIRAGMKHVKQSKTLMKLQEDEAEDDRALMIVDNDDDDGYSGDSE
ncbi:hypothetical protein EW026_g3381 [Hermanssonia centrifuga]|uniref:Uncharacterized protein n=1 Tax=Hermanssonia centrifuga TaxID=98765 RepID=A0A4S4KKU7_9APHY|nr:hypothetical protein EW026_g3381 [Hermanssonia centrifuga]